MRLHLLHDASPSSLGKGGIARRQVGAGNVEIERGLPVGFVLGMKEREGFGFVLGVKAVLFADAWSRPQRRNNRSRGQLGMAGRPAG
jgi:hypothetical protein